MTIIFSIIRKKKIFRVVAAFVAINILTQIFFPSVAWALTSGPSQPELQSFEPAGTSDMVDLFSGDFNYNIPLFDLPGPNGSYPFNLAYHSGINMDQEASWTGLGWNVNPGAINRDKRGLPDDFKGDKINTYLSIKDNETYGVSVTPGLELWGGDMSMGTMNIGLTIYNNSYKGVGYSLEPSFRYTKDNASVGIGVSLNSQEGVGIDADITFGKNLMSQTKKKHGGTLGVGFSSQRGLSLSVSGFANNTGVKGKKKTSYGGSGSSTYSFAEKAFMPAFTSEMKGTNLQVAIKFGIDGAGAFSDLTIGGFYSTEGIKHSNKAYNGYGYNYLEASAAGSLMDFNREKDGIIRKETPNLPAPVLTHDTYMALGQGYMGSYRAHRSDMGHLHDPFVESKLFGGSIGVELGPGYPTHLGVSASFNETILNSGDWDENNDWENGTVNYIYNDGSGVDIHNYEKLYYKMKGETNSFDTDELDYIGGEKAVRASLDRQGSFIDAYYNPVSGLLVPSSGPEQTVTTNVRTKEERINRNSSIQPITNDLLMQSTELLNEYQLKYYTTAVLDNGFYDLGYYDPFDRTGLPSHHTAGFTCVNSSGLRYVYALPAYNKEEKEIAFTVTPSHYTSVTLDENTNYIPEVSSSDDQSDITTDQFKSVNETPDYAHGYLLTSVLGADYVDADATPGPSDGDYGYWVKFTYVRTAEEYQWRSPYDGAMYLRGQNFKASDDKGIFSYGKKDIWYLATAETKSHIAVFKLSERHDGLEAKGEYYSDGHTRKKLHKLSQLSLYSKPEYAASEAPTPLKTVHFEYDYSLCPDVPNNDGLESGSTEVNYKKGKLTLKKLWFTYQNNTRGELSPYTFDYNESDADENPSYNADSYDRWGSYKDAADFYRTRNLPYTTQFDPSQTQSIANKASFKENMDLNAAVWNLKTIGLPTGGAIDITYEADDYAYVQHRQATQMFKIDHMIDATPGNEGKVYNGSWDHTTDAYRRVYFKLENPIPDPVSGTADKDKLYKDYLAGLVQADGHLQMYFRLKSKLRDNISETVTGYSDLENDDVYDYDFDPAGDQVIDGVTCHTIAYVTLKLMTGNNSALPGSGVIEYHPFAVAGWQYMRTNAPELLTAFGTLSGAAPGSSAMDKAMKVKSLLSVIPAAIQTFTGYRKYASNRGWAKEIDEDESFIRLATPDKAKFGGGLRVKRVTYTDNWAASGESSNSYGQIYTYTTTEGTGADAVTISSGVAQYEPLTGGDEIALRHAKNYMQTIPLFTDNNLFFEYPINESYYPAPNVGYSKVTVQSIASYRTNADNSGPEALADKSIPTTGLVEYRFYTAHDYPVITDETDNQVRKFNLFIPIPLIGQITSNKLYGTQGYAITLNDMHGKLRSVTNYSKNINGELNPIAESSVEYKYMTDTRQFDGQEVNVLDNTVSAIVNEYVDHESGNPTYQKMICKKKDAIIGEEYDFFVDSRQSHVFSAMGGLELNIELATPVPFPCPWPSFASTTKNLKTLVTNKVIQKSGILESTIATDGQSIVTTTNKLFDAQTGSPLLTVVNNDFNNPVYNYAHPAYWEYDGMGAAAQNHNYSFYAKVSSVNTTANTFSIYNTVAKPVHKNRSTSPIAYPIDREDFYNTIAEGDELIIKPVCTPCTTKYTATLITKSISYDGSCGKTYNLAFHSATGADALDAEDEVQFTIVRSGRRNMLNTNVGSIAALKDPTDDANRELHTTVASTPAFAGEFASLFNTLLDDDCDLSADRTLPLTTIDFSNHGYFGNNASVLYPALSNYFKSITIDIRPATSTCHDAYDGGFNPEYYEYYMTYIYMEDDGSCATGECCLGLYGVQYCLTPDPESCTLTPIQIENFSLTETGTLQVEYGGGSGFDPEELLADCFSNPAKYTYIDDVISSSSVIYRDFWDYDNWTDIVCGTAVSGGPDQTNLYSLGKKGIWKPYMNYYYKDERENQQLSNDVNIDHDGVYKGDGIVANVNEFYLYTWKPTVERPVPLKWLPNSLVVMYDQNSNALQTQDIVKIYSSVGYGYDSQLPVIQGNNASRDELFFESFDDPASVNYSMSIEPLPHTGKYSVNAVGNSSYVLNSTSLQTGKSYTISLWTNSGVGHAANYAAINANVGVKLAFYDESNTLISTTSLIQPSGNVIEGWQRIEGNFSVPSGTKTTKVNLRTSPTSGMAYSYYFDDIRIFPTLSNVSTSVYDAMNFRVSAVLDANNYATFYSYDEEGKLFLVRKETIDGIKTIKEERAHIIE
jgi:hypothetical protein